MKAKIKKTGEIINIASYAHVTLESCDSYGNPIELGFDEIELLEEKESAINWEQRRYELAKAAMQGVLSTYSSRESSSLPEPSELSKVCMKYSYAMILELKEQSDDKANNT
jgi:hypothetical protein